MADSSEERRIAQKHNTPTGNKYKKIISSADKLHIQLPDARINARSHNIDYGKLFAAGKLHIQARRAMRSAHVKLIMVNHYHNRVVAFLQ